MFLFSYQSWALELFFVMVLHKETVKLVLMSAKRGLMG